MARVVVSDPEEGRAYQVEPEESQFNRIIGREIGDQIDGDLMGLSGYEFEITGGSDAEGFPMRSGIRGRGRSRILLKSGTGYNPTADGERRRKGVRGRIVSDNIVQLNVKIVKKGSEPMDKLLGLEPIPEEEEGGAEESAEEGK